MCILALQESNFFAHSNKVDSQAGIAVFIF